MHTITSNTSKDYTSYFNKCLVEYIDKNTNVDITLLMDKKNARQRWNDMRANVHTTNNDLDRRNNIKTLGECTNMPNKYINKKSKRNADNLAMGINTFASNNALFVKKTNTQKEQHSSNIHGKNNHANEHVSMSKHNVNDCVFPNKKLDNQLKNTQTKNLIHQYESRNHVTNIMHSKINNSCILTLYNNNNIFTQKDVFLLDDKNELLNYLKKKASKNTIYDKKCTFNPLYTNKGNITLKHFVTEHCRNNNLELPEYLIEKQNDVFVCKAEFIGSNFASKYHFEKGNALEEVCLMIVDFLMDDKKKRKNVKMLDLLI